MTRSPAEGSGTADRLVSTDPHTGERLGDVPLRDTEAVESAVETARRAFATWGGLPYGERRKHLLRWARLLARRVDDLADLIHRENGKPHLDAVTEVLLAITHLRFAAKRARRALRARRVSSGLFLNIRSRVSYSPMGVVAVIGPWNMPLFTPLGSIGPALAAGNTVVFKPSELTPLVGQQIEQTFAEAVPIPGVLQVVTGDGRTGEALARAAVDKIAFTGSAAVGRKVMATAADRLTPVVMELGGKDALVVAADADVTQAARAAVWGAFMLSGQACISIERAYVARPVYERFVDAVVEEARRVRPGSEASAHIGAMTRPEQVDVVRDHLEDALRRGAKAVVGGPEAIAGRVLGPTVLVDVNEQMKVLSEETFGPVLPIARVEDVDEGIRRANASEYGLGAAVFARSGARRLADRLECGMTSINSVAAFSAIPSLPFGGRGQSGFGRVHGQHGLREFSQVKATTELRFRLPVDLTAFQEQPEKVARWLRRAVLRWFG